MALIDELKDRADKLDAELLALSGRMKEIEHESDAVHICINALDIAEMDAEEEALGPIDLPAEPEAPPSDTLYTGEFGDEQGDEAGAAAEVSALAEFMKRDGATEWLGGGFTEALHCKDVEVLYRDGRILQGVSGEFLWSTASELLASGWRHEDAESGHISDADDIIAYRIISQPADHSEPDLYVGEVAADQSEEQPEQPVDAASFGGAPTTPDPLPIED